MKTKTVLQVSAVIFTIITIVHLLRAVLGWPANIGLWQVPIWVSWIVVVVAGFLAYAAWTAD